MEPASHIGWLRAAVVGANDGIVSTASLVVGRGRLMLERLLNRYTGQE